MADICSETCRWLGSGNVCAGYSRRCPYPVTIVRVNQSSGLCRVRLALQTSCLAQHLPPASYQSPSAMTTTLTFSPCLIQRMRDKFKKAAVHCRQVICVCRVQLALQISCLAKHLPPASYQSPSTMTITPTFSPCLTWTCAPGQAEPTGNAQRCTHTFVAKHMRLMTA